MADFLDARLEEHGVIARGECAGIMNVHLVHAGAMLAIVAFDFDAMIAHHAGNAAQQVIVGARLADRVTVKAGVQGCQIRAEILVAQ